MTGTPFSSFEDAVAGRRMVRSFLTTPLPDDLVDRLVGQCLRAPSAGNSQSLQVLVLDGDAVEAYWDTALPPERRRTFPWPGLLLAPVLIVPYVEPQRYVDRYDEPDKSATGLGAGIDAWQVPYWWVDGGAAVQTLLLGAAAVRLGACLFGQFEHEAALRDRFGVPESMRAIGTVALGYENVDDRRAGSSARRSRRPQTETVHRNIW